MNCLISRIRVVLCFGCFLAACTLAFLASLPFMTVPAVATVAVPKIPVGTVIPVSLEHLLSTTENVKNELLEGTVPQDVPLSNKEKIPSGSKVYGKILDVTPASGETGGSRLTFQVTMLEIHGYKIPIVTGMRAMAPLLSIQRARTSIQGDSTGSPYSWATTVQIGGDIRYGEGGKVTNRHHRTIGKGTEEGAIATLQDPPDSPCAGWPGATDSPQAVWVFSGDACGVYDLKDVRIAHAGNKDPFGEITLAKNDGNLKIMNSSGMLLRIVK